MFFLAFRHLLSRPHQTILTFLGIMLGAAGYVVFAGIQLGQQEFIIDRLINTDSQIRISPRFDYITEETFKDVFFTGKAVNWIIPPSGLLSYQYLTNVPGWFEKLDADPEVLYYSPQLKQNVIYSNQGFSIPGTLIGIDTVRQPLVTNIEDDIVMGSLKSIGQGNSLILIGQDLMQMLGSRLNGSINVVTSDGTITPLKIVGYFKTGARGLDSRTAYASVMTVQQATKSAGQISDIVIKLKDVDRAAQKATEWTKYSPDQVQSWDQSNVNFLEMIRMQNIVRQTTTFTIILIVAFGIYNILNMVVNQKKKEIAILRSMGYNQKDTIILFLIQGIVLGLTGALLGILLGYAACSYLETIKIGTARGRGVMGRGHILISWNISIYLLAFILAFGASVIASFIPARTAGRLSPIDIIRGSG
jgi:lipoprotein-releasing system permease protein